MPRSGNIYYSVFPETGEDLRDVVLIHGAGGSGEQWPFQLRRLPGARVYAVDLPGHGKSDGEPEKSIEEYAARVREWMDRVGVEKACVVGHSMGAAIALMLALQAAERVEHLVLLGAAARFPVNPILLDKLRVPVLAQQGINMIVNWSFAKGSAAHLRTKYFNQLTANKPGVLYGDFASCAKFDLGKRVDEIRRPVLVLSGEEDTMVPANSGRELAASLLRGKLQLLRGCGHMLMQERPVEIAQSIEKELALAG